MVNEMHQQLGENDEVLLMRFYDGECGFLSRMRAQRLLRTNEFARSYFSQLEQLNLEGALALKDNERAALSGLWEGVSRRIEQEERAELFLGRRRVQDESHGRSAWIPFGWGVSGAAATAAVALLISVGASSPESDPILANAPVQSASIVSQVQPVSIGNRDRTPSTKRRIGSSGPVEVDWVRSEGQVRFIPDSSRRSAVFWVKKRAFEDLKINKNTAPLISNELKALMEPSRSAEPELFSRQVESER